MARLSKATPLISEPFDSLLGVLDLGHFSFVFLGGVSKPLVFSVSAGLSVPGAAHAVDGMPCLPMTKRKMMGGGERLENSTTAPLQETCVATNCGR